MSFTDSILSALFVFAIVFLVLCGLYLLILLFSYLVRVLERKIKPSRSSPKA
ncbi:hypothetical protein SDC9_101977 [bioreactor metagenome]|uniref:Uncharacterized protein n=1 Tax=bioreactor metagenome TaxID=1076179 RepID=A0A645B098_9ZZZZ